MDNIMKIKEIGPQKIRWKKRGATTTIEKTIREPGSGELKVIVCR